MLYIRMHMYLRFDRWHSHSAIVSIHVRTTVIQPAIDAQGDATQIVAVMQSVAIHKEIDLMCWRRAYQRVARTYR